MPSKLRRRKERERLTRVKPELLEPGFECPVCSEHLNVISTFRYRAGLLVRYRECANHCTRLRTEERAAVMVEPRPRLGVAVDLGEGLSIVIVDVVCPNRAPRRTSTSSRC